MSSELRGDPEVALAAMAQYGGALQDAAGALRDHRDIVLAAVTPSAPTFLSQDGRAMRYATDTSRGSHAYVLAAV